MSVISIWKISHWEFLLELNKMEHYKWSSSHILLQNNVLGIVFITHGVMAITISFHSLLYTYTSLLLLSQLCCIQGLSQDLETGYPILAIVKFWGVPLFKGDLNIYSDYNHKVTCIMSICNVMGIILRWKKIIAWNSQFKKFLTKNCGCPAG